MIMAQLCSLGIHLLKIPESKYLVVNNFTIPTFILLQIKFLLTILKYVTKL